MTMSKMELLRAKMKEQDTTTSNGGSDYASYRFWDIPENKTCLVRFLPDGDTSNDPFFWREKITLKFEFPGIVEAGNLLDKPVTVTVPCIEMWGDKCPVIEHIRPWWKDESKKDLARKYYKKKSAIFQGFVVQSPLVEENTPENIIRRFVVGPALLKLIREGLSDPDMEDLPTDYINGRDFKITKTKQGAHNNYGTSSWSFKTRQLTEVEQLAISQHGLFDLKQFIGKRPSSDELDAIKAMFAASLAGDPYDSDSFSKYYKPYGVNGRDENADAVTGTVTSTVAPTTGSATAKTLVEAEENDEPMVEAKVHETVGKDIPDPRAIMDRIRKKVASSS